MYLKSKTNQFVRYVLNGIAATAVHYGLLSYNLNVVHFQSAGLASFVASIVTISMSFIGNRYFVFNKTCGPLLIQALKFIGLYGSLAILHGLVLFLWTDWLGFDFRIGFLIATTIQLSLSYLGNKKIVFNA